jgi:hypothetical protein
MAKRKTCDPRLIRLAQRRLRETLALDRWLARLLRAAREVDARRKTLRRIGRSITQREQELDAPPPPDADPSSLIV